MKSILFTDLDGTLLDGDSRLSRKNRQALLKLGDLGIVRVVITGRSLFSAGKVLKEGFPIEYLVTSNGAGIFDFQSGELLESYGLSKGETIATVDRLLSMQVDFMVHSPVPDNHHFEFHGNRLENSDFSIRCERYGDSCSPMDPKNPGVKRASQFLVIARPDEEPERFHLALQEAFPALSVIRTTSPLDHCSCWIELFPPEVSKAKAAAWLCQRLGIERELSLAVGNDYNDLDLLEWCHRSAVVGNAPLELRRSFRVVSDNNSDGFSEAVDRWVGR